MDSELVPVDRGSQAWAAAWDALAGELRRRGLGDGTDLAQEHPTMGERWQLMGCLREPDSRIRCEFRHRAHPRTETRLNIPVVIDNLPGSGPDTVREF